MLKTVNNVSLIRLASVIWINVLMDLNITRLLNFVQKDVVLIIAVLARTMEFVMPVQLDLV